MVSGSVGERIAVYRRRRGLSQAALAALIGRSESWLSQVERGLRSADRLSVLMEMASILRVDLESLTGDVRQTAARGNPSSADLSAIRRHFAGYDFLTHDDAGPAVTAALQDDAARVHEDYQAANYRQVVAQLPRLLATADAMRPRHGLAGYFSAYLVTPKLLTKMGAEELAVIAADRCATAAQDTESAEIRALAAYQVVCAALRSGRREDAENLAVAAADGLGTPDGPALLRPRDPSG